MADADALAELPERADDSRAAAMNDRPRSEGDGSGRRKFGYSAMVAGWARSASRRGGVN